MYFYSIFPDVIDSGSVLHLTCFTIPELNSIETLPRQALLKAHPHVLGQLFLKACIDI